MTATDSLTLSDSSPSLPSDPAGVQDWLDGRMAQITALLNDAFAALARRAATDLAALTAAAPTDPGWAEWVTDTIGPLVAETYMGAALATTIASPAPPRIAELMVPVVNQAAVDYTRTATNRIVGAGDSLWRSVRGELTNAVATGMSQEDLKGVVERVTGYSEFRADTIARTETMMAWNHGDNDSATALGQYGPVEKEWLAALDARTRESHVEANGQVVPFNEDFIVGGNRMPFPGSGPPEETINCRCVVLHYYPGDTRSDGTVIEDPNATPVATAPEPEPVASMNPPLTREGHGQLSRELWEYNEAFDADRYLERMTAAVNDYTAQDYNQINGALRHGTPTGPVKQQIAAIDRAFTYAPSVEADVTLFRGTQLPAGVTPTPGAVLSDKGFLSVSGSESAAARFAERGDGWLLRIQTPRGTSGIPIPGSEQELILARNTKLRVTAVNDADRVLDVELVQ